MFVTIKAQASRQNYRLGPSTSRIARRSLLSTRPSRLASLPTHHHSSPSPDQPCRAPQPNRGLATAVGSQFATTTAQEYEPSIYHLRSFDPSKPMILKSAPRTPPIKRPSGKGVTGDVELAIPVFEACLRVGKLERAQLILQRVEQIGGLEPEMRMQLANQYLEANVRQIKADPGIGKAEELHAWYEMHVREAGIPQSPETIAFMLKASLLTTASDGTRLTRWIKRYMGMVPPDQGLDVLYCTDILTDSDIATITQHYPDLNISALPDDTESPTDLDMELHSIPDTDTARGGSVRGDSTEPPQVVAVPQKGSGLKTIQGTLEIFQKMKNGHDISTLPLVERREFQSRLERDCIDMALERWRETDEGHKKMGLNSNVTYRELNRVLWTWQNDLEPELRDEIAKIKQSEEVKSKSEADVDRLLYGPILMLSTPERLAAVAILSLLSALSFNGADNGVPINSILSHVAKVIEEDIRVRMWDEKRREAARKEKQAYLLRKRKESLAKVNMTDPDLDASSDAVRDASPDAKEHASPDAEAENAVPRLADTSGTSPDRVTYWPIALRMKIASVLVRGLTSVAKITVVREDPTTMKKVASMQPAFTRCHQFRRGRKLGVLVPHPSLTEILRKEPNAEFLARHLPMVVEPKPWKRFDRGAYQESPVPLIRIKSGEQDQRLYAEAALARGDMDQILKGLDVLGKTAWRINRPVFDVLLEAWNQGEAIAKIPPLNPDIHMPPEPDASADPLVRRTWVKALKVIHNQKMSYHSIRCFMNFQLEIARAYRDQEFFFPHNVDFRGRAYPIPTYLNHMGADHMRGLLRFSRSRELGERGLMWLKVHLANVYGYDKASLRDRESFATENLSNIMDSANNPLNGERWWLSAEDPWQCLATCFELKAALESPDPTKYKSSLPVHQDGTCNGLQHYAALGGDSWGASQVNLSPGDKPADVYSAVADLVREGVDKDAALGNPMAKAMVGKIKRKVVKQTVMTNVYGVTFAGAKKQVLKQINALYPNIEEEKGVGAGLVASYITTRIFKALSTMFKGAHDIQYWLGEIGGRVCRALTPEQIEQVTKHDVEPAYGINKAKKIQTKDDLASLFRSAIIWTTPLRMPIVQPYRKSNNKVIVTSIQTLTLQNPDHFDPVDRRKQLQAFPPNFIHSLDASHMMLSALECHELGLDFAAVHDSFWTHAADVDVMNRVLRDAFIRIHKEDVIKRLLSEFEARYRGGLYLARVKKDTEAGRAMLGWRKLHRGLTARDELILEKKRIDLLSSEDPAERQEGEQMTTPASLFATYASENEAEVVEDDELSSPTLGSMSEAAAASVEDSVDGPEGDDVVAHEEPAVAAEAEGAGEDGKDFFHRFQTVSRFEEMLQGKKPAKTATTKKKSANDATHAWLPLTFPNVPKKGDFQVEQLRESEYFFS